MTMPLPETFDPATQDGNDWEVLPPGEYVGQAIEARVAPPKSGDGYGLTLTWKIMEGDYENRQVWQYITYVHSSQMAQSIGRKMIKDLCTALDILEHVEDAEIFLFKPARIRVGVKKDQSGQDRNEIKRVLPVTEATDQPSAESGMEASKSPTSKLTPRTQGAPRSGPVGTAPWHNKR